MTGVPGEVTLSSLADQIDGLTKRFDMRFATGREQSQVITDLQQRLTRAENERAAWSFKPLVDALALVIGRLRSAEPSEGLLGSVAEELEAVLGLLGLQSIQPSQGQSVERSRHEVQSLSGSGPRLTVVRVISSGYEKDGVVLRPAVVEALRSQDAEPGGTR